MFLKLTAIISLAMLMLVSTGDLIKSSADFPLKKEATYTFEYRGEKMTMNQWSKTNVKTDFKTGTIYIGAVEDSTVYEQVDDSIKALELMGFKTIIFDLHSPGGSTTIMSLIIIDMDLMKAQGIKVVTRIDENNSCMSACTLIFLNGDVRIAHRRSVFMIHSPYLSGSVDFGGREAVKQYEEQDLDNIRAQFKKKFIEVCGDKTSILTDVYDKVNHFYASRALKDACPAYITNLTGASPFDPSGKKGF